MSERVQDYVVDYSVTKLEETARTFRRLGEAYENASEPQKSGTGISKQLFLVADVLEECMTMYVHTEDGKKDFVRELTRKCFVNGIRIKNVQHLSKKNGRNAIVFQARTVGQQKKLFRCLRKCCGADIIRMIPTAGLSMKNIISTFLFRKTGLNCSVVWQE
jgi:hypothetical protein